MQATYIEVSAEVRYWEDAAVNGTDDAAGTLMPMRKGDTWAPVIRLADGAVMDWPQGTTADVHYKVCDAGEYWLLDDERRRVAKWAGFYVPDAFLCHGNNGYGDYIIFKVGADGLIAGWKQPAIETVCECDEDAQHGWRKLPNTNVTGLAPRKPAQGPVDVNVRPLPCPFCGMPADLEDNDTLYPTGCGWLWDDELKMKTYHRMNEVPKEQWCWGMHCPTCAGGCGAEIHGDSRDEALAKWNKRPNVDVTGPRLCGSGGQQGSAAPSRKD